MDSRSCPSSRICVLHYTGINSSCVFDTIPSQANAVTVRVRVCQTWLMVLHSWPGTSLRLWQSRLIHPAGKTSVLGCVLPVTCPPPRVRVWQSVLIVLHSHTQHMARSRAVSYLSLVTLQARLEYWAVPYLSPTQPTLQLETNDFVEIWDLGLVAGLTPQCY